MSGNGTNTNTTDKKRAIRLTREAMQDSTVESIRAATSQLGDSLQSFDKQPLIIDMSNNGIPAHVSIEYLDGGLRIKGMFNNLWAEIGFKKPGRNPDPFCDVEGGIKRVSYAEARKRIRDQIDFFADNILELHARAQSNAGSLPPVAPTQPVRRSMLGRFGRSRNHHTLVAR